MEARNISLLRDVPWHYENPRQLEPFWFEEMDFNESRRWAREQLPNCAKLCTLYFLFVLFGPIYMKNRKPYKLRSALIAWNFLLAIFSIAGVLRMLPELITTIMSNGFYKTWCARVGLNEPGAFWGWAFAVSKIWELGDTVFLILRKKPLSFLHWFHHCSMVMVAFFIYAEGEPVYRWGALLNYSIHSVMYTYYTLMALKFEISKTISKKITSLQIAQFVTGLGINGYTAYVIVEGGECIRSWESTKVVIGIGLIYLTLFMRLFYKSYMQAKPKIH